MAADDILGDGESQTRSPDAIGTATEEGLEDPLQIGGGDANPRILDPNPDLARLTPQADAQTTALGHGMQGVLAEIEDRHAQLTVTGQDPEGARGEVAANLDSQGIGLPVQQAQVVVHHLFQTDQFRLTGRRDTQFEQPLGDLVALVHLLVDQDQVLAGQFQTRGIAGEGLKGGMQGHAHRGEGVVDLMGDAGGKTPQFGQLLLVGEVDILGQIPDGLHHIVLGHPALYHPQGCGVDLRVQGTAIQAWPALHEAQGCGILDHFSKGTGHQMFRTGHIPSMAGGEAKSGHGLPLGQAHLAAKGGIGQDLVVIGVHHPDPIGKGVQELFQEALLVFQLHHFVLQGRRHAIEAPPQLRQFVRAREVHPRRQVAVFQASADLGELADGSDDIPPHEPPAPRQVDQHDQGPGARQQQGGAPGLLANRLGDEIHIKDAVDRVLVQGAMTLLTGGLVGHRIDGAQHQFPTGVLQEFGGGRIRRDRRYG